MKIDVFLSIDSTNQEAIRRLAAGCTESFLLLSESQTSGYGHGKSPFYSPPRSGLYFTIALVPKAEIGPGRKLSRIAGIAVCESVLKLTGLRLQIHKVNDLYLGSHKVGGILTEAFSEDLESMQITSVISGIGLYVTAEAFPDLQDAGMTSLMASCTRNQLAADITNRYLRLIDLDSQELQPLYESWHV